MTRLTAILRQMWTFKIQPSSTTSTRSRPIPPSSSLKAFAGVSTARIAVLSPVVSQRMTFFLARQNPGDLAVLRDFLDTGKVTPVIDRVYPLSETAEAIRYLETGHARGKVVITV